MSDLNQSARLNRNDGASSLNRATFVAEPLESGFGLTLGNALRRVLLSSLQGAAVTAIRIDNVLHEFSGLAGVREDVVDIVQNVKQIALRMQGESSKRLQLSVTGPAEVTAGMIATSADIEVMNPQLVICHVDDSATLNMELTASVGRGYAPAAANRPPEAPLGLIPVDALYSPIRQVAYQVEELSLEHGTTADRLSITIQTDGSVEPQDALSYAAIILQDQLHLFTNSESSRDPTASSDSSNVKPSDFADLPSSRSDTILSDVSHLNRFLVRKIEEFELSVRSMNGLKGDNIIYVGDLAKRTEAEMLRTPNFGRKSLTEVKEMLAVMGLRLGMNIPGWPPENIESLAQAFADEPKFSGRH